VFFKIDTVIFRKPCLGGLAVAEQLGAVVDASGDDLALVRVRDVAAFLALSRSKVYELMGDGTLPFKKIGKSRRIPRWAMLQLATQGAELT
jgi:excisionase family DNA binding protein